MKGREGRAGRQEMGMTFRQSEKSLARQDWDERQACRERARKARKGRTELKGQGIVGQDRTCRKGAVGTPGKAW